MFYKIQDDELNYILLGKNIDLSYFNVYSNENKIEVNNDEFLKYFNYIFKTNGVNKVAKTFNVTVSEQHSQNKNCYSWFEKNIWFCNKEKPIIAGIKEIVYF